MKDIDINYQDVITLSDNNKYLVTGKVSYNSDTYLYLVNVVDYNIKFVMLKDEYLEELDAEKDKDLINKLLPLFYKILRKDIKFK